MQFFYDYYTFEFQGLLSVDDDGYITVGCWCLLL
jgi:hypothetical protein